MHPSLTIVIPCYNEEKSLPVVVPALMEFAVNHGFKVVIVNDGSKDHSKSILENFAKQFSQLTVLHHKVNKGYGGAIKTGIAAADTELVITIDADGQHNLNDVVAMRDAMTSSEADMI